MEKICVTARDIADTATPAQEPTRLVPKLPPPVPWWAKLSLTPLVLLLPVLCLVALVVRVAMRRAEPRIRYAWLAYLSSLLIVSGVFTSMLAVVAASYRPVPAIVSTGLSELDEKREFPVLPATNAMSARNVSDQLKPLVTVISPAWRTWFTKREMPSASMGAGVLLHAGPEGYLIATARHVIDGSPRGSGPNRALVAMSSGVWADADVVARHQNLDLLLLWVKRVSGSGTFVLPVATTKDVSEGENIFVIGHPEGLRYTLSTGIVSRTDNDVFQISAPVSPGNSGGPVFDDTGHLAGIVTSMVDKGSNPNAENLNFAVRADALLQASRWKFVGNGRTRLESFLNAQKPQQ